MAPAGLIVSVDIASAALDFGSPEHRVIFEDGAAAVAIEADGPSRRTRVPARDLRRRCGIVPAGIGRHTDATHRGSRCVPARPRSSGWTALPCSRRRPSASRVSCATCLPKSDVAADELGTIVPHQASAAAIEHLKRAVHRRPCQDDRYLPRSPGNQIAAGMPHALHVAHGREQLAPGSHSLLIGTSAGVSLGGAVIRW